jgi:hypothetical protein
LESEYDLNQVKKLRKEERDEKGIHKKQDQRGYSLEIEIDPSNLFCPAQVN